MGLLQPLCLGLLQSLASVLQLQVPDADFQDLHLPLVLLLLLLLCHAPLQYLDANSAAVAAGAWCEVPRFEAVLDLGQPILGCTVGPTQLVLLLVMLQLAVLLVLVDVEKQLRVANVVPMPAAPDIDQCFWSMSHSTNCGGFASAGLGGQRGIGVAIFQPHLLETTHHLT